MMVFKDLLRAVSRLTWPPAELEGGKVGKLHQFPLDVKVKLFGIVVSTDRTGWLITNDLTPHSTLAAQQESAYR